MSDGIPGRWLVGIIDNRSGKLVVFKANAALYEGCVDGLNHDARSSSTLELLRALGLATEAELWTYSSHQFGVEMTQRRESKLAQLRILAAELGIHVDTKQQGASDASSS